MADDNPKPIISEDLLFEGDLEKINQTASAAVKAAVEEALKKQGGNAGGQQPAQPKDDDPMTKEQIEAIKPEELDWAVFKDDDEDIRETAAAMLAKELKKLPDNATRKDVNAAAEKVSQRLAKVMAGKGQGNGNGGTTTDPIPMQTSGAAPAHLNDKSPTTVEEAEAMADKIAAEYKVTD